jgi:nucleotide-binding universal stress UspA family protein
MYARIVIATDGSDLANKGVDHGLALAQALSAQVVIVTVTEPTVPIAASSEVAWVPAWDPTELDQAKANAAANTLASAKDRAASTSVSVTTEHVVNPSPAEGIIQTAKKHNADLIVVASHGRRGIGRLLLGSQANAVVSQSDVPVLVVR